MQVSLDRGIGTRVELRVARQEEKPGYIRWCANNTYHLVSRSLNTYRVVTKMGFFREIFNASVKASPQLAHYPTWVGDFYLSADPAVVKVLLEKHRNGDCLSSGGRNPFALLMKLIFPLLNFGNDDFILTCSEERTRSYRQFLHAHLTTLKMQEQNFVMKGIVEQTLNSWEALSEANGFIDLSAETKKFSSEVIGKLFLDYRGSYEELTKAFDVLIHYLGTAYFKASVAKIMNVARSLFFLPALSLESEEVKKAAIVVAKAIDSLFDEELENPVPCLIQQMKTSGQFSKEEVYGTAFALFFAGQDTVANTINYILFQLAQNEDFQTAIVEESLPIEWVIVEGIRMMPAAGLIGRIAREDLILTIEENEKKTTHCIPKGARIAAAPMFLSRDPANLSDDAGSLEIFNPYRWSDKELPPLTQLWSAFGGGTHQCPGHKVAKNEMEVFLKSFVERFRFSTERTDEPRQKLTFTVRAEGELFIRLQPRE